MSVNAILLFRLILAYCDYSVIDLINLLLGVHYAPWGMSIYNLSTLKLLFLYIIAPYQESREFTTSFSSYHIISFARRGIKGWYQQKMKDE
jgi:presenilin-like A22 family membrane protease